MKELKNYLNIIKESEVLSTNDLGLSKQDLENIEKELTKYEGKIMSVKYSISNLDDVNNKDIPLGTIDTFAMKKEIEHVYGHALEGLITHGIIKTIADYLKSLDNSVKYNINGLDGIIKYNDIEFPVEIKTSKNDLSKTGTTANHGRGIHINSNTQYNKLKEGALLIFINYSFLENNFSGIQIKKIYVRTPNLIEVSNNKKFITKINNPK